MPTFLTTNIVQATAFVLFLASLPLISFGATGDTDVLWWTGLALLVIAGILPPLARFVPLADDDEHEEDGEPEGDQAETDDTQKESPE